MKEEVNCNRCNKRFLRETSIIKRYKQNGIKHYCSRVCVGKSSNKQLKIYQGKNDITVFAGNRKDEFTGLRDHLRRANRRNKEVNITLQELKNLWLKQDGICTYSGVKLVHPTLKNNDPIYTASLDRINSSIGYVLSNLQFISMAMNYMKNSMSHEQTLKLCELLKQR